MRPTRFCLDLENQTLENQTIDIEIPYTRFVLPNGLRLLVHQDHKAPIVAVNIWYHVGSKNERPGHTGFAHLFEHLMFNGSEHFNDDYFQMTERLGATDLNGTTGNDRTNYFQNVPASALDAILWLESDRMGHLLGAVDQAKLDEQRGVVKNEIRQNWSQPYGLVSKTISETTYPAGHPYSWPISGTIEDLDAATLENVHDWFRTYYGAANAVLVLAGDIDAETARRKVARYFAEIPPGPPLARMQRSIAPRRGEQRQMLEDRVPQARLYKVWNVPEWGTVQGDMLRLLAMILAKGKASRLYRRLVHSDQVATTVAAAASLREIAGQFSVMAEGRGGVALERIEEAIDEELARLITDGVSERELERVRMQVRSQFIRGIERIGGFGGKSDILALNEVYAGSADFYKTTLERIERATPGDLLETARRFLSDGSHVLEVRPFGGYTVAESSVDRSLIPAARRPPAASFPPLERTRLSNGLEIILAERRSVPQANISLMVDAGYATDVTSLAGRASMAMEMLQLGTSSRTALQLSEEAALLGALCGCSSTLDTSTVSLSALLENLEESLDLFADIAFEATFPQDELERLRSRRLAQITQEQAHPTTMALRVFPRLLYGEGHPYSNPFTGSGTIETIHQIDRSELVGFHRQWFKPNNAVLIVVGATSLDEIVPLLEKRFGHWQAGEVPGKTIGKPPSPDGTRVYIMDRKDTPHSMVFAAQQAPPKNNPREIAIEAMNTVLGGTFTSRINMNLREDKHWSYGASSLIVDSRGIRPYLTLTSVQADKTAAAMLEILREIRDLGGPRPPTAQELDKVKEAKTRSLPGKWETMNAVGAAVARMVRFGLDDDYYQTYADKVRSLSLDELREAARETLRPDDLIWIVVGDRSGVEPEVRRLDLGPVQRLDAGGRPIER